MAHESFEDPAVAAVMNARLRQHQGRPRGAARPRPDLPDGACAADAALGRLAAHDVPDAGRRAVLRRHVFPEARAATGCPAFSTCCRASPRRTASRAPAIAEQTARLATRWRASSPRRPAATRCRRARRPPRSRRSKRQLRPRARRLRRRAQVSASDRSRVLPARSGARRDDADALAVVARHARREWPTAASTTSSAAASAATASTREWTIPHFEKMLYDNGPLLGLYADLARVTGDAAVRRRRARHRRLDDARDARARRRVLLEPRRRQRGRGRQVLRLDARRGARAAVPPDECAVAAPHFGLDRRAEFRRPRVEPARRRVRSPRSRRSSGIAAAGARRRGSTRAKATLFAARAKRVRPGLDDKILTSWNALAIAGLARAARALDEPRMGRSRVRGRRCAARAPRGATAGCSRRARASTRTSTPISTITRSCSPRCSSSCRRAFAPRTSRGRASSPTCCSTQFEDREHGGFFFTSHDHERLFHRTKPGPRQRDAVGQRRRGARADRARPSCRRAALRRGGRARGAALRAGARASRPAAARRCSRRSPTAHAPPTFVLLAGDPRRCAAWQRALERTLSARRCASSTSRACDLPRRARQGRRARATGAAAWVCRGTQCLPPVDALRGDRARCSRDAVRGAVIAARRALRVHGDGRGAFRYHAAAVATLTFDGDCDEDCRRRIRRRRRCSRRRRAAPADAAEALMKKNGCTACHAIDKKIVGPSYIEVAAKYKGDADAAAKLVEEGEEGRLGRLGPGADAAESATSRRRHQDAGHLHPRAEEVSAHFAVQAIWRGASRRGRSPATRFDSAQARR